MFIEGNDVRDSRDAQTTLCQTSRLALFSLTLSNRNLSLIFP